MISNVQGLQAQVHPNISGLAPERLRLAVIGAGLGSAPHFQSLADLASEAEVVWVYGRSAERLSSVRTPTGARQTTRLEDILEDTSVQAVLVLTPPNTHLDLVQRAARAGKHVLVEKPLDHAAHRAVLQDFIRAVQQGKPPAITGRSALGVQQVIESIMESSRAGGTISLPASARL
jgi:predicted dehydrogenase